MKKNHFPVVCRFLVAVSFLTLCLLPFSFAVGQKSAPPKENRKAGERMTLKIKDVEYAFRWCPAGTFTMGSPENEEFRGDGELQRQVTLSRGFWMLETEVTQTMWESVMEDNPSKFKGKNLPVEQVSWNDCQKYISKLNDLIAGTPGAPADFKFTLPTEAQWEYACRAGTTTAYSFGTTLSQRQANFWKSAGTSAVGKYPANAWGLKDMHGNVWELCLDWHSVYPEGAVTDPVGALRTEYNVMRGGSWYDFAEHGRSANRKSFVPTEWNPYTGLRLALVSSPQQE